MTGGRIGSGKLREKLKMCVRRVIIIISNQSPDWNNMDPSDTSAIRIIHSRGELTSVERFFFFKGLKVGGFIFAKVKFDIHCKNL